MKRSIQARITVTFMALACLMIMGSIWINQYYLETYYQYQKKQILVSAYDAIEEIVVQEEDIDALGEEDSLKDILVSLKERYNITCLLIPVDDDEEGVVYSYASSEEVHNLKDRLFRYMTVSMGLRVQILDDNDSYSVVKTYDEAAGNYYLDAYGYMKSNLMFMMSLPIESIRESASIANKFLMYTGLTLMMIISILMMIITKRITLPILKLASISKRMAKLDFSERYYGMEEDEIGILGSSINEMADQLEKTIVELQDANEQLKKDIEEKIQIDEMRKEFLSNVSHELKTPLALISGYAEGLQEAINDDDPESRQFYCEVIMDEASKMTKMVQKLLSLNHLEFGQDAVEFSSFDLSELIHSVVDSNDIRIKQKMAEVDLDIPDHMIVVADEFKIEEVVTNYFSNALNHLDYDRKIHIYMTEDMEHVEVHVHNTGNPIPEEDLEKVWIKFYKVDKARTREYGGSGIGLSIVKAIMDSHKQPYGVINIDGGVEFWFQLNKDNEIMSQFRLALPECIEQNQPQQAKGKKRK